MQRKQRCARRRRRWPMPLSCSAYTTGPRDVLAAFPLASRSFHHHPHRRPANLLRIRASHETTTDQLSTVGTTAAQGKRPSEAESYTTAAPTGAETPSGTPWPASRVRCRHRPTAFFIRWSSALQFNTSPDVACWRGCSAACPPETSTAVVTFTARSGTGAQRARVRIGESAAETTTTRRARRKKPDGSLVSGGWFGWRY